MIDPPRILSHLPIPVPPQRTGEPAECAVTGVPIEGPVDATVRVGPHVSWTMPEAIGAFFEIFEENLEGYRRGEPLHGLVDPSQGYRGS